ncbi:P-loop containing nucleoside triphosphate hydrolase protein [Mycena galericulata]|nr:P-loop containing nucleoside triphosphate hydrolase protein [Mycena galericulata]
MYKSENVDDKARKLDDYSYTTLRLGVWRLLLPKESFSNKISPLFGQLESLWTNWNSLKALLPTIWRFMTEIFYLSPALVLLDSVLKFGAAFQSTLTLYTSARLLRTVEIGLTEGKPDINAILQAVFIRVMVVVVTSMMSWGRLRTAAILQTRIKLHFEERVLRGKLRLDLPTSADKSNASSVTSDDAWKAFDFFSDLLEQTFQLANQLVFISQQISGGFTFTILSIVSPLLVTRFGRGLWMKAYVAYADNVDYLRLRALNMLTSDDYREDVITANIGAWILTEFKKARERLGNISDARLHVQYASHTTPIIHVITHLSQDLPTLYWAASAIFQPKSFTVTSFAILQQQAQALNYTVQILSFYLSRATEFCSKTQEIYDIGDVENRIVDGDEAYPNNSLSTDKGMSFELRNVSFAYPGGKSKDNAIKNISLNIPAGHLVVIVGANGSGKSTIIKLLNRLYDADSGEILVDGMPIKSYRIADLRKVQALLAQDHKLFPLTLAENIGLGNTNCIDDLDMVKQAAEYGGASEVISKLSDGIQTILSPVKTAQGPHLDKDKDKKLKEILESLEKQAEVSGGEKQRLVASRTFMRFLSGGIRFAVADEPSSALDPKAEHRLFQNLREFGDGKTLIFVTHRFGHLTKHADLVICMKDGQAVESGTHQELMARGGEYSELYNVQAQAFTDVAVL